MSTTTLDPAQLDRALAAVLPVEGEPTPETRKAIVRPLAVFQVASDPTTDPRNLLGRRFLCRGGALLLAGPTGVGKSSLLLNDFVGMIGPWSHKAHVAFQNIKKLRHLID